MIYGPCKTQSNKYEYEYEFQIWSHRLPTELTIRFRYNDIADKHSLDLRVRLEYKSFVAAITAAYFHISIGGERTVSVVELNQ